jgi:cytochrome c oxidase cbb3-type subunit 3
MKITLTMLLLGLAGLAACSPPAAQTAHEVAKSGPALSGLPNGDLAGAAQADAGASIRNPLEGRADAIAGGKRLFVQMNCAGCHGYDLTGGMGPDLTDNYWRYGGSPGAIYRSISSGHPQGMPAWGRALPPDQIWQLVAYIQSYGGATPADAYQSGLQGDQTSKTTPAGGGTGSKAGAKSGAAPAAQPANP